MLSETSNPFPPQTIGSTTPDHHPYHCSRNHHETIITSHPPPPSKLTQAQRDHLKSLFTIIRHGDYKDFTQLIESGKLKNLLNVFCEGQTPLHYSLIYGRSLAWCKQLLLNGANPNLTNFAGWHPIHLAAFNGSSETMRYLIDSCDIKIILPDSQEEEEQEEEEEEDGEQRQA